MNMALFKCQNKQWFYMKNNSKAPRKPATKTPQKSPVDMTQTEYRAHYERRTRNQKFKALAFGMNTEELCRMFDVSDATIRRWKAGTFQPPFMALELLRMRRGLSLPAVFGNLAGFTVGHIHGQTYLIPPNRHWSEGITATEIIRWPILRHVTASALAKKPANAGSAYAGKPAANDVLPIDTPSLEAVNDQRTNDRGCDGDQ